MLRWRFILIPATIGVLEAILFGRELQVTLASWVNLAITFLFWPAVFGIWSANKIVAKPFFHSFIAGFSYNTVGISTWTAMLYVGNAAELRPYFPQDYGPVLAFISFAFGTLMSSILVGLGCGFFTQIARRITKSRYEATERDQPYLD